MLIEALATASLAVAGSIAVLLWADARVGLDRPAALALLGLITFTVLAGSAALRMTVLPFAFGSVPAAAAGTGGWLLVIQLTTRPGPRTTPIPQRTPP
ncbi:MAG: hypothetical protein AB7I08_15125 [Thermoleophilia bacterium]